MKGAIGLFLVAALLVAAPFGCAGVLQIDDPKVVPPDGGDGGSGGDSGAQNKRVFATSQTYSAKFGGTSGADAICRTAASALGGTWVAWLTQGEASAQSRITSNGPWYLVGTNTRVFVDHAALSQLPGAGIDNDETGKHLLTGDVWTGTRGPGVLGDSCGDCSGWAGGADAAKGIIGRV